MVQTLDLIRRTFGWTGATSASASVARDNGTTVRTNRVPNPAFATDIGTWSIPGGTWDSTNKRGSGSASGAINGGNVAGQATVTATTGERRRFGAMFYNTSSTALPVSLQVQARNASGVLSYYDTTQVTVPAGGSAWLTNVIPAGGYYSGADRGYVVIRVGDGGWAAGSTWQIDNVIDTELGDGTPLQPSDYFDGDTTPVAFIGGDVVPLTSTLSTLNGSSVPLMLIQFAGARTAQHVIHEILGRSDPDVTFMPTQTRAGTLTFLYESLDAVAAARDLLALPGPVTLAQTDMPALSMTFVVAGDLEVAPDQQDPYLWTIAVPFREAVA